MPKYIVGDKKYNIPQEEVEGFLAAFPNAKEFTEDALEDQAGKIQPQVTGATAEETTAPDTEFKLENGLSESPDKFKFSASQLAYSPSEEEKSAVQQQADSIFIPENEMPEKNVYTGMGGYVYKEKDKNPQYDEYVQRAKQKAVLTEGKDYLQIAKEDYIQDKLQEAHINKLQQVYSSQAGIISEPDKETREQDILRLEATQKALTNELEVYSKNIETDYNAINEIDKKLDDLSKLQPTNQDELRKHSTIQQSLLDSRKALFKDYAKNIEKVFQLEETYKDNASFVEALDKTYNTVGALGKSLGGSVIGLAADFVDFVETIRPQARLIQRDPETGEIKKQSIVGDKNTIIDKVQDYAKELQREAYLPVKDIEDVKSASDFGYWFGHLATTQAPIYATLALAPQTGLYLVSASAGGSKKKELRDEIASGEDYTDSQILLAVASSAASAYVSERVTQGQVNAFANVFRTGTKNKIKNEILDNAKRYYTEQFSKGKFLIRMAEEGGSEVADILANNATDVAVLGKQKSLWEGVPNAFASGAFMSGVMTSTPALYYKAMSPFVDTQKLKLETYMSLNQLEEIQRELQKEDLSPEARQALEDTRKKIQDKVLNTTRRNHDMLDYMSNAELTELTSIDVESGKLRDKLRAIQEDKSLSNEAREKLYDEIAPEIQELANRKDKLLNSLKKNGQSYLEMTKEATLEEFDKDQESLKELVDLIPGMTKDQYKLFENEEQATAWLKENAELTPAELAKAIIGNGYVLPGSKTKDGKDYVVTNKQQALKNSKLNVGRHEGVHLIFKGLLKNNPDLALKLGKKLEAYLENSVPDFKSTAMYADWKRNYLDDKSLKPAEQYEELFSLLSEYIDNLGIKENVLTKIGDIYRRAVQRAGFKIELETGKQAFNLIKDYNRSFAKQKYSKSQLALLQKGEIKDLKLSITAKDKQDMMDTYNRLMEGVERTEYSKNNPLPRRLENELVPKFQGYVNTLVNKKFRQVEEEAITKEDAVMILMAEVANALRTFNPAKNDDIAGYVASIIARRQSMVFADVSQEFTDDVTTSKEVQSVTVEIDEVQQEKAQQDRKETLLEAVDVKRTVEGRTYEEHVIDAVSKNARLAIKVYGEEISANRTVTPFVARVKDGLAKDLRQITKKFINEYGYEAFLKDHKPAILKNFTTTYLSKHPLFRKGIEKSIGGKMVTDNQGNPRFEPNWTLPTQTSPNKFEWVDVSGKKAKIDRDNSGLRGLTSGPEIIRRSPKINSIVTDNEFIDYHFADGALRKKKKQNPEDALAMQIASEIGFDLLKQDLNLDGEISQQLKEVGELFDKVIAEAELNKLSKDLDRGTIKFSKSSTSPIIRYMYDKIQTSAAASEILNQSLATIDKTVKTDIAAQLYALGVIERTRPLVEKVLLPALKQAVDSVQSQTQKVELIEEFLSVFKEPIRTRAKVLDAEYFRTLEYFGKELQDILSKEDKGLIEILYKNDKEFNKKEKESTAPIKVIVGPTSSTLKINGKVPKYGSMLRADDTDTMDKFVNNESRKRDMRAQNALALARMKRIIFDIGETRPLVALSILKLAQQANRGFLRQAARLNAVVLNRGEQGLRYEHNPPVEYVYDQIENYFRSKMEGKDQIKEKESLEKLLDTMEANIVPKDFSDFVDQKWQKTIPTDGTQRYDEALKNFNYKFDTDTFNFSITKEDTDRLNKMISDTGKLTTAEISEATATRMAKNKGMFRFYIPPSADDFAGLMYYMLRSGKLGEADMQFIKEKLLDPFAQNHAAWESYKLRKLNDFRTFKKLIRNSPTAKLTAKNNAGFTNEDAVRVWLWNKKGTDLGDTITSAEKTNLIEIVESNPDLLQFAQSMANLFGGAQNYPDPSGNWFNGSMTIDVIENINEFGRKTFFRTFNENVEEMFGKLNNQGEISGSIANKLRAAYGNNYVEALSDIIYRMKNGRSREFGKNRLMNQLNNWISNSVGAVMFFNTRSAILQQVSMINFINLSDNNPIKFAQAIANPKQYWSDWLELINSDFLVSRRQGIKIDVNQDEIAKAAESGRNPVQSVISMILKKGFMLTTWGDSNAIAMGGATFYRNRINTYLNEGLTEAEAKKKAFEEFKEIAEESQQSSRPDRISQQQASTLGKAILAWANTPMQYARLTKKATLDLINGRGDWKTNMSKIIYYGAVQNLMFTYMQQGLFSMIFDGEDQEEEDAKKWEFTFNSMADGFLRGLGFGGAIASTAKNMVIEAIEQSKGRGNYDEVVWEALKLSPPLGSKIAKARAVGRTFGWKQEREKVFTEGLSLDNPAFEAVGKGVSALTNVPLDRVVRKLDNISYPMRHDVEFWQGAALYLGWGQWELGLKETNKRNKDQKQIFKEYKFNDKLKEYKFKD